MKRVHVVALLWGLGVASVAAQSGSLLSLTLERSLVVSAVKDGKTVETLKANSEQVAPGAVLLEQVRVENLSDKILSKVKVDLPLPKNVVKAGSTVKANTQASSYLAGTATKPSNRWTLEFSRDGGKTFAIEPLKKVVKVLEGGKNVDKEVVVSANEYTHARWTLANIAPKEKLVFGLRAKVN